MKRREFLRSAGGALGAFVLAPQLKTPSSLSSLRAACAQFEDDEKFWRLVRSQFLLPEDYAYFNTGGLGSSPVSVLDVVKQKVEEEESYPSAGHNAQDWWGIKDKCGALLGPSCKKEELAFTSTATEGINIIINGLPLEKGDEVIISTHEHVALNIPLLFKMQTQGIVIRTFEPDLENGLNNAGRVEELINNRTRLIFLSHVTCTTGQIFPIDEVAALAEPKGIWLAVDGAQAVANIPIDLAKTGADFYAFSGHKWLLGPKRTGIFFIREDLLETLQPSIVGAYSDKMNRMQDRALELHPTAQRYEYGTQNDALIYGLGASVEFVSTIGTDRIWMHNKRLAEIFYCEVIKIPGVEILSPAEERFRSSMITFRVQNRDNTRICSELIRKRLRVRSVGEADLDGIRVSFHVYNNEDEIDRLLEEIKKVV